MNKNINKIIAATLVISGLSAIEPSKYINLFATKAEAASSSKVNLKSIGLSDGEINFSQDTKKYTVRVANSIDQITIKAKPDAKSSDYDDYTIDIDGQIVDEEGGFRAIVNLTKGNNDIDITISNKDGKEKTYKLTIIRGKADDETEEQYGDDVYLDDIYLDYGDVDIDFDKDVTSYNINVPEDMESIMVRVDPEDKDGKVQINGMTVKEDKGDDRTKDFRKEVKLQPGSNEVEIKITDDEEENQKIYTLNINRGKTDNSNSTSNNKTDTSTNSSTNGISATTGSTTQNTENIKANQWVQTINGWNYNDKLGDPLKNTWFLDNSSGKNYYLKSDGIMATGWLNDNYNWYYLNESGARESGWKYLNNNWYYLDNNGVMQKGWFKDTDGNWYYLKDSGEMARNIKIGGYALGSNGAWVK